MCKNPISTHWRHPENTIQDNENYHSFCCSFIAIEHNRYSNTTGETHSNSKFADFSLKINDDWQESSSRSKQHNAVTVLDQN